MEAKKSQERKTRTITLTDRRPVKIYEDEWPIIASAESFSGQHECQANEEWGIKVREHDDGRRLVYAWRDRGPGGMSIKYRGRRGGYLIAATQSGTIEAIKMCGDLVDDSGLADEVIADLPAEEI